MVSVVEGSDLSKNDNDHPAMQSIPLILRRVPRLSFQAAVRLPS